MRPYIRFPHQPPSPRPIATNEQIQAARARSEEVRSLLIRVGTLPPEYTAEQRFNAVRDYVDSLPSSPSSSEDGYQPPPKPIWRRLYGVFTAIFGFSRR